MRSFALYLLTAGALFAASPASPSDELSLAPPFTYAAFEAGQGDDPAPSSSLSSAEEPSPDEDDDDASEGCGTESPYLLRPDEVPGWQTRSLDVPPLLQIDRDVFKNRGPPLA
jgi:hypothetical protein